MAYKLAHPPSFPTLHPLFHVSILRRYVVDQSHQISYKELELYPELSYEEVVVRVMDHCLMILRRKEVTLVKVLWSRHDIEEAPWEHEDEMRPCFVYLFAPAIA